MEKLSIDMSRNESGFQIYPRLRNRTLIYSKSLENAHHINNRDFQWNILRFILKLLFHLIYLVARRIAMAIGECKTIGLEEI